MYFTHPSVLTCCLVGHANCTHISVDSTGRTLFVHKQSRDMLLSPGGELRKLNLSAVAPGGALTVSLSHAGDAIYIVAYGQAFGSILKASWSPTGEIGSARRLLGNVELLPQWRLESVYAAGTRKRSEFGMICRPAPCTV